MRKIKIDGKRNTTILLQKEMSYFQKQNQNF